MKVDESAKQEQNDRRCLRREVKLLCGKKESKTKNRGQKTVWLYKGWIFLWTNITGRAWQNYGNVRDMLKFVKHMRRTQEIIGTRRSELFFVPTFMCGQMFFIEKTPQTTKHVLHKFCERTVINTRHATGVELRSRVDSAPTLAACCKHSSLLVHRVSRGAPVLLMSEPIPT